MIKTMLYAWLIAVAAIIFAGWVVTRWQKAVVCLSVRCVEVGALRHRLSGSLPRSIDDIEAAAHERVRTFFNPYRLRWESVHFVPDFRAPTLYHNGQIVVILSDDRCTVTGGLPRGRGYTRIVWGQRG